ncbi:MAG: DUF2270 domain-containing protein [Actinomycetota bacterium]
MNADPQMTHPPEFSAADIAALAHLYRGELYRSTVWRTRLDTTTNWAVVTTGLAMSLTFSSASASPLPLLLVSLLVAVFLSIEARRYRFFDFWRIRAHILETNFFGPILLGHGLTFTNKWNEILYADYIDPQLHITFREALGRRLRRNYGYIFLIQMAAYLGKVLTHPFTVSSWSDLWERTAVGPVPGQVVVVVGVLFHASWMAIAYMTFRSRRGGNRSRPERPHKDRVLELARGGPG